MKTLNNIYSIIATITLLVASTSCGTQKHTASQTYQSVTQTSTGPSGAITAYDLEAYSTSWQKLSLPVTLRLKEPKSISVSATATMERGKSITLSMRILGMEIGVVHLTTDSVIALDKYNHRYVSEPLKQFLGGVPADISNLQDLLIGHPFLLGKSKFSLSDFDTEVESSTGIQLMMPRKALDGVEYGFSFTPEMQLGALIIKAAGHQPITVKYADTHTSLAGPVASSTSVNAITSKSAINATLDWNFGKAKWDADVNVRTTTVPKGYTRIPASSLLKIISEF